MLAPVAVVVPEVRVSTAGPPSVSIKPPVEVTAPVSAPLLNVPPASATALMVCANPPRFSVPPVFTVVALVGLNTFAAPPSSVPPVNDSVPTVPSAPALPTLRMPVPKVVPPV